MTVLRRRIGIALLGLCAACTADQHANKPSPDPAIESLRPLFRSLDALHAGTATRVALLQIGDSHTANDGFSGRMRLLFQTRFGNAGRGMLQPGIPFGTYHPDQVSVTAEGWRVLSSMQSSTPGPFGLGAQRQHASGKASMTLRDDGAGLGTVWIEALGQPDGGTITIQPDDAAPVRLATNATEATPLWQEVHAQHALTVSADGTGPVDLLSWSTAREQPGVTYSNLGTIGATVNLIGRWDPTLVASEIGRLKPALVLVAFGTNEGFRESLDTAAYQADFAERLQFLRAMAPDAGFLIVGPPDGSQHAPPGAPGACHDDPDWHVPPHLAEVREAQRTVARQQGIAFWDWSAAMGGRCSMARWARMDPPMSAGDHVHLLHAGYQATAETLFADIMRHYARYQGVPAAR